MPESFTKEVVETMLRVQDAKPVGRFRPITFTLSNSMTQEGITAADCSKFSAQFALGSCSEFSATLQRALQTTAYFFEVDISVGRLDRLSWRAVIADALQWCGRKADSLR